MMIKTAATIRATANEVGTENPSALLNWLRLACGNRMTTYVTKELSKPEATRSICKRLIISIGVVHIVSVQGIGPE